MVEAALDEKNDALERLCKNAKRMMTSGNYIGCYTMIRDAMSQYPNAPHPHNLLGILYEREGRHTEAMKHFRAALALDPTYCPASQNLDKSGTFYSIRGYAFDEGDCIVSDHKSHKSIYKVTSNGFLMGRLI